MATDAQITANRLNAQHSTGPQSESGKAASSQNNFRHGLAGCSFRVLPSEDQDGFDQLLASLTAEHQPATPTEAILISKMAQHYWLSQRAQRLQDLTMAEDLPAKDQDRQFSLFLRYQTTNDRAFHRCLTDLLKLRAEKRRSEIGFESQQHKTADQARRQAAEKRKQDLHELAVLLAEAKLTHRQVLTNSLELNQMLAASPANHFAEAKQAA